LADEVIQNSQVSQGPPNQSDLTNLVSTLQARQDAQFQTLTDAIQKLNTTLTQLVDNIGNANAISMSSVIPSIQPTSVPIEMVSISQPVYKSIDLTIPSEGEEEEVEVEEEEEIEVEEEVEEEEVEVEEEEEEVEVEDDEEVEVEEWTYKGMMFFKDSNHVVYSKDGDEIGEPIGKYDPVKKILKKI
jgi:flagellar hook assembly protein FlgD